MQELAYALATAIAVLDAVKERRADRGCGVRKGRRADQLFVNAGIRFVTESQQDARLHRTVDEIARERYGVKDEKYRRFRYGVQVNCWVHRATARK
ncbi:MAG: hypothetical protein R3D03_18735 [Geminicoccaceae bacterium]